MKFKLVPLFQAKGKILAHNIAGKNGERLLRKGKPISDADLENLRALGRVSVYVAEQEPDDVDENTVALRIANAICGSGLYITSASAGRVNLLAKQAGILRIDVDRLEQLNEREGITVATLLTNSPVSPRQMVATVKIIPYAIPESVVCVAEGMVIGSREIVCVDVLLHQAVGMILTGSLSLQKRLVSDFYPIQERIERLGSCVERTDFVALDDEADEIALAEILQQQVSVGMQLIIIAGETAIMDRQDIVPRAVERAGGTIEAVGAPVDPGNLLMLAYLNNVPIVGAPGCARSRRTNVVDWILPRLLVGDRLTRKNIIEFGHGGLLQDVQERGMPREID